MTRAEQRSGHRLQQRDAPNRVTETVTEPDETIPPQQFLNQIKKKYTEPETTPSGITRTFTPDSAIYTV